MQRSVLKASLAFASALALAGAALAGEPEAVSFASPDGVTVFADHYPADESGRRLVLLFHQARSNRGEYRSIAPRLQEMGFSALAVDQRSGGSGWGLENDTVAGKGKSSSYLEALPDLEAALSWAKRVAPSGKAIVWGSSYSASLALVLAADHPDDVAAVLAFSPGEYFSDGELVRNRADEVRSPVAVFAPQDERQQAEQVFGALDGEGHELHILPQAVHGSSMLIPDRNPAAESIWPLVAAFLDRVAGAGRAP